MTCAARCPFKNSPGGLIAIMREVAIKHGMQSAKDVLRPFGIIELVRSGRIAMVRGAISQPPKGNE